MIRVRLGLGLLLLGALACSSKSGGSGSSTGGSSGGAGTTTAGGSGGTAGGSSAGSSGGTSGGTGCEYDVDCLATGKRCSPDGGCTLPAAICDPDEGSSNCTSQPYCWPDGINTNNDCYCHPLLDGGGVCYVQLPPCAPCTNPLDCGTPDQDDDVPATCGPLGTGSGSYCLPLDQTGVCPSGYIPGETDGGTIAVCVPSCGSCPCAACTSDSDCKNPASGVCNGNGVCAPPCQTADDCPAGQVCNVIGKYLDPAVGAFYGDGKCGLPCSQNSDCTQYQEGAAVPLVCDADAGDLCRPAGCLHDSDCTGDLQQGGDVIPWCDIWGTENGCVNDACRLGLSPVDGGAFEDCFAGYQCLLADGGSPGSLSGGPPVLGDCFLTPCNLAGGAHIDCAAGQLCCGEGDAGSATDCGGAPVGACYPEPRPPWCQACDPSNGTYFNSDCAAVNDGYPGAVICSQVLGIKASPWCGPACTPDQPWTCPDGWECARQPFLASDCSQCPGTCLDAGQSQGEPAYQCGCNGLLGCPVVPQILYEGSSCGLCPQGDAGCVPASDGQGVNCTCDPEGGACPPYQWGGQTYPTACVNDQGVNACAVYVPMQCENSVCSFGYNCATSVGCPDAG